MRKPSKIGIFGATGAVGAEILDLLLKREHAPEGIRLFASGRSEGKRIQSLGRAFTIERAEASSFAGLDAAFFAVGGAWSKENAPRALAAGCIVIDNSSTFRYDPEIPLVIPSINGKALKGARLIANPNCTTAIAAMALHPLHLEFGLKTVIISTYQAVSGAGAKGIDELEAQTAAYPAGPIPPPSAFRHRILFNLIPQIDVIQENGYTKEEMKVVWETRKIFGDDSIGISCTCVRVPVLRAHSEAITLETRRPIDPDSARRILGKAPGVKLVDDTPAGRYPMPMTASGRFEVEVGRIRTNLVFGANGLDLFVSGDQLLRGAALNAVEILECL